MADEPNTAPAQGDTAPAAEGDAAAPASDSLLTGTEPAGDAGAADSPDGQGDGEGSQEDKPADGDDSGDKSSGPPEKYELSMPEGFTLDEAAMEKFDPVLRDLGLDNEQASKLASVYAEMQLASAESHIKQVQEWGQQAAQDPEIGGAKFNENVALARKGLAYVGDPELTKVLDTYGLGNHPSVIKAFVKLSRHIPQGDTGTSGDRSGGDQSIARKLYPNMA